MKNVLRNVPPLNFAAIFPAVRNDGYWLEAQQIAIEIAASYKDKMDSPPVGPVRLMKLGVQAVQGLKYYLTFRVKGQNGLTAAYKSTVWIKVGLLGHEIQTFEKVIGSERKTKSYLARERMISGGNDGDSPELAYGDDSAKLLTRGFYLLVEKVGSKRPTLSYAKARKSASLKWGRLSDHEKMVFVREAAERLEKK